jgi:RecJ-like exonuclease
MNNDDQLNYNKPFDINEWKKLCEDAYDRLKRTRSVFQFIEALSQIDKMKCTLFTTARVVCKKCGGTGKYSYPDTATWLKGIGGQSITEDVCDKCWGTGRSDRTGLNLRKEHVLSE